jgi:hypothetical protein
MLKNKNIVLDAMLAGILFIMVLMMLMLSSCRHEPDVIPALPSNGIIDNENGNNGNQNQSTCDPDSVYFTQQVLPLFVSNCAKSGCHTPADHADGIVLDNYQDIMSTADIRPGNPTHGHLYDRITDTNPNDRMPPLPSAPLNASQITLIYTWISPGAKNNFCSNSCDTTNVNFSSVIFPLIQTNCTGCHSGSAAGGQIQLTNYQTISAIALNGKLYGAVSHSTGYSPMPKGGNMLQSCQIDQVRIWIQNGTLND